MNIEFTQDQRDRFLSRVAVAGPDDCWEWQGYRRTDGYAAGYGQAHYGGYKTSAHRLAYLMFVGAIEPDSLEIDHLCRNRACVNPRHLEAIPKDVHHARTHNGRHKESCVRGHPFVGENIMTDSRGSRQCRTCERLRGAKRRADLRRNPRPITRHGVRSSYTRWGCRCKECYAAEKAYQNAYKARTAA